MNEPTFSSFQDWYENNAQLVQDLQTWLFYRYAQSENNIGKDVTSKVEVADMTVYLLLFYLSSLKDNSYTVHTSIEEMTRILETEPEVVERALNSLQDHHVLHYHNHDDHLDIHIEAIRSPF